jgi:hypothetical protein
MNSIDTNKLCNDFLNPIILDSQLIIKDIELFFQENKHKTDIKFLLRSNFKEQIDNFNFKYRFSYAGLINKDTNTLIDIDFSCTEKLNKEIDYLLNYIDSIPLD